MKLFTAKNKNIILVSHDNLSHFGEMRAGRYVIRTNKISERQQKRCAESYIPEGHLEKGGIIIGAINYPSNVHWVFGTLSGVHPPVIQIRNDKLDPDDHNTISAATLMTNSLLQVH